MIEVRDIAGARSETASNLKVSIMADCPVKLDYCARSNCRQGHCALSGDRVLDPCAECGELVIIRRAGICVECIAIRSIDMKE